jgi:hypothetical protein
MVYELQVVNHSLLTHCNPTSLREPAPKFMVNEYA